MSTLALANNPMAWGAPVVSFIITLGFFGILTLLIARRTTSATEVAQIVNITVGVLAAAFATVVSFWLGSSQGSRQKDDGNSAPGRASPKPGQASRSVDNHHAGDANPGQAAKTL